MKKIIKYSIFSLCLISSVHAIYNIIFYKNSNYEKESLVEGKIVYIDESKKDRVVFDIKGDYKYRCFLYNKKLEYKLGDKVKVYGLVYTPNDNTNFNTFNYRKYLLSKNIKYVISVQRISLKKRNKNIIYKLKTNVINYLNKFKRNDYMQAFILGETTYISDEINEAYQKLGISHLLAISGSHVTLIVSFLNIFLKKNKYKDVIIFPLLFFFLFLTNFAHSLLRCIYFLFFNYLNKKLKLNLNSSGVLIITFLILLLFNSNLIYSSGFLFSTVISFYLIISQKFLNTKNYFRSLILITIISFLSSIPIIAITNYNINLLSIIYNLIFVPLVSFTIFPLSIITFIIPFLDNLYNSILNLFDTLIITLSSINYFNMVIPKMNIGFVVLYYVFLYFSLRFNRKYFTCLILVLIINSSFNFVSNKDKVVFLDVGQGDSTIIIDSSNKVTAIDTGGLLGSNSSLTKNTFIPYLNSIGINKVQNLIITHGDYDHMGEAINLVNNFKVEKVIFNCGEFNELEQELIKVLHKKKIPYYSCIKELNIDDSKLYFLNNKDYGNENDNSSVIYTELNNYKFLFMGDAGVESEEDLIKKYNIKDIDVLKVGHHGSRTSSSKSFIGEVNPKYSIISVGKNNRYGHPNDSVLDNLEDSQIYRTDQDGSIMFKIRNNKLEIKTCSP